LQASGPPVERLPQKQLVAGWRVERHSHGL
jgi:hypothetical protein